MRKHLHLTAVVLAVFSLGACAHGPDTEPAPGPIPSVTTTAGQQGHSDGDDHKPEEHYGVPEMTWSAQTEADVRALAGKAMGLFARPDVPEAIWFTDLAPYLSPEYAAEAKYIDPARVPVRKILTGPDLGRDAGNPATVTAYFSTDAGGWQMILHRAGPTEPWRVTAIEPREPM